MSLRPMTRGDSRYMTLTVLDQDGDPVDLTDAIVVMTAVDYPGSATPIFQKSSEESGEITITDATGGICEVVLLPEDTEEQNPGMVWYDVEVTLADDTRWTVERGDFILERDYTTHEAP